MNSNKSAMGIGLLTAVASSLCCITPLLALLAGTSGLATTFQWVEPLRPYLIGLTVAALGFAWYQQLKPVAEDDCGCEVTPLAFFKGKKFLGIVTVFAALMLAFPMYSRMIFPPPVTQQVTLENKGQLQTVEFLVNGMTCGGCEVHVEHAVGDLSGIIEVTASHQHANTRVTFDSTLTSVMEIEAAINATDYRVTDHKRLEKLNSE